MKLTKEQIEQARKYFKMMLSHFEVCNGKDWMQGGDFYHLPPAQIPVRCVETIRKALSCSTHKTGLCATSDTDKNTPENLRKSLDFIEREYLDYEEKNNKIKGMYIHLDNLRHALSAPKAQEWQDISTAPKDGTIISLWCVHKDRKWNIHRRAMYARYNLKKNNWCDCYDNWDKELRDFEPTHWKPLDKPPTEGGA